MPGNLSYPGLLNLGKFENFSYEIYELPIFVLMGSLGGLSGAFWNHINYKLAVFRIRSCVFCLAKKIHTVMMYF